MRVVADTNIIVSGLLWHGPARQLLNAARQDTVELFTSGALLELKMDPSKWNSLHPKAGSNAAKIGRSIRKLAADRRLGCDALAESPTDSSPLCPQRQSRREQRDNKESGLEFIHTVSVGIRLTKAEALFGRLLQTYHYLGYRRPVGEHVKYLIYGQGQPVACLAWSSARGP